MIEQTARPLNISSAGSMPAPAAVCPPAVPVPFTAANENRLASSATRLAAEALAREKARQARARARAAERRRWLLLVVAVLALLAALRLFATDVVRMVPGMAHVYQAAGLPVHLPQLRIDGPRLMWSRGVDGRPQLLVAGRITNTGTRALPMPRITLMLLDDAGNTLHRWHIPSRRSRPLPPGASLRFRSRLARVPAGASTLRVHAIPATGGASR